MDWRDQLKKIKCRFRDAEFLVDAADGQFGRRQVTHEYPMRDQPYVEDLGRRAREITVEAFVLGVDYMTSRDALIRAVEQPGPGTLVHPYLGTMRVSVTQCRVRESSRNGGMATFTLTFVEAGANAFPSADDDTAARVDKAATAAMDAATVDFARRFGVSGFPGFVAESAITRVQSGIDTLAKANARIAQTTAPITDLAGRLTTLGNQLTTLVYTPAALVAGITGVIVALGGVVTRPAAALRGYRQLFGFGDDAKPVPRTTPSRIAQSDNQDALHKMIQRAAVVEASRAAGAVAFDSPAWSSGDVSELRDDLVAQLDAQAIATDAAGGAIDDSVYEALIDLRAALVHDLTTRGALLPRLVTYTPAVTLPAVVLSQQIYGDASRADEIAARNNVRHPGFVRGGQTLEVLSAT